jgi:tetratricopeptide (TPR) repeat protein
LQQGQDQKAKQVRDELLSIHKASVNFASAYAFAAIPARYTLERRSWSEAAVLSVHPEGFPWQSFPEAQAITYFARALGAARQGNVTATQTDLEMLKSLHEALIKTKAAYWADQVVIQQQAVKAWIAYAEERTDAALELMRSAAKLEDETEKHPVTPGEIVPAHELLGDLLLELSQPAEALGEFEASLRRSPNRFNGLFGAARAAEMLGEQEKAKAYYEKLVELAGQVDSANSANTGRTRLQQAEAFLAKHSSL